MRRLAYLPFFAAACTAPSVEDPFATLSAGTVTTQTTAPNEESGSTDETASGSESSGATESASTTATTTATTAPADSGSSEESTTSEPLLDTAIYHCQQAAEKVIKGWLQSQDDPFPKTHDVEVLAAQAAKLHGDFTILELGTFDRSCNGDSGWFVFESNCS